MKVERLLKYTFTRDEIVDIAQESASAVYSRNELELQLDSIKADFKGRIGLLETSIDKAQRKIRDGYEMRDIECECRFHTPVAGYKQIVRLDTGEVVAEEAMLPHERQEILPFRGEEQAEEPEEAAEPAYPVADEYGAFPMDRAQVLKKDFGEDGHITIYLLEVGPGEFKGSYMAELAGYTVGATCIHDYDETMPRKECLDLQLHELLDWLEDFQKTEEGDKPSSTTKKKLEVIAAAKRVLENYRNLVNGPQPDAKLEDATAEREWPQPNKNGVYEPVAKPAFEWTSKNKKSPMYAIIHTLEIESGVWIASLAADFKTAGYHGPLARTGGQTFSSENRALIERLEYALALAGSQKTNKEIAAFEETATEMLNALRSAATEDGAGEDSADEPEADDADE